MTDLLLTPLADAFLQVGVPVAVLVAAFGLLQLRHGDRLLELLRRRAGWAPAVGALLGVTPGCAGAILVMPLFTRGTVSFGTVVAALVATMGDSSWVLIAGEPVTALWVHGALLVAGLTTGYAVDALRIGPRPEDLAAQEAELAGSATSRRRRRAGERQGSGGTEDAAPTEATEAAATPGRARRHRPVGGSESALVRWTGVRGAGVLLAFWAVVVLALPASVALTAQVGTGALTAALGGLDPVLALGVLGAVVCGAVLVVRHGGSDRLAAQVGSRGDVLRRGAAETSVIVAWVAAAFVAWEVLSATTGFDGSQLPLVGVAGVVLGALVGLVPGCAVQIVLTSLYLTGAVPLPTLLANAVSQDGDALIPLLAMRRRSALLASAITTVPALVVGGVALALTT
ncbi:putative manganese transporter [Pseudokineococcus sp. 1T1Z-3]|uniref:putative manganese transporter n=1 Tax=Pseudokineococcus sp. 1T1Z-3 TaxID=3132745 RepID=UPI0030A539B8